MKLLVALSRFPWPLEKGDKLRAYYQLKGLAEHHEVHLVCLNEAPVDADALRELSFCKSIEVIRLHKWQVALNLLGGIFDSRPFQVHYFRSARMRRLLAERITRLQVDAVYVQLIRLGMNLPAAPGIGWLLDYQDTFSIGMRQRIGQSGWLMRPLVRMEARRLAAYERAIAAQFDQLTVISERDRDGLPQELHDRVHIIPNGVGEAFFEPLPPLPKDFDLVFFGNMGYQPNVQSVRFLMDEVVPALQARGIEPKICLAGARPSPAVQAYASENVLVTGMVPDLRSYILRSRLSIAPVISGQGLQNKLLESMAMGMPTLTTPLSHAAVPARAGEEIIVCADAEAFAAEIARLLADPEAAAAIGERGRAFVAQHYRWQEMNRRLEVALEASIGKAARP
jgi:sugar transferase (PEP-CTERM/EpsH1 system associated)